VRRHHAGACYIEGRPSVICLHPLAMAIFWPTSPSAPSASGAPTSMTRALRNLASLASLATLLVVATACPEPLGFDDDEKSGEVDIRVENASTHVLADIEVGFPEGRKGYGTLAPGQRSQYRTIKGAYRYAYIEAMVAGSKMVLQPIDYVGESFLAPGRYTYIVSVPQPGVAYGLSLTLRKD